MPFGKFFEETDSRSIGDDGLVAADEPRIPRDPGGDTLRGDAVRGDAGAEIPRGSVSRISRLMKLWHESPERAVHFIDPKHAEAMWGASKAKAPWDIKTGGKEEVLAELWLRSPERAMRYIGPVDALMKFGCPPAMTRTRFVHLKLLHARLHEGAEE